MEMNAKIMVKSNSNATIVMNVPTLNLRRVWEKRGAVKPIPFEILSQAIYDEGVEKLFKDGTLTIDDKQVLVELGIEEEIIILSEQEKKRYLTLAPLHDLKEICQKLPKQQILDLVYYAIDNEIGNFEKAAYLKGICGVDIMEAIKLNRAAKDSKED